MSHVSHWVAYKQELSEDALEQLWEATENPGVPQVDSSKQNREFIDRLYRLKMDCILRETNSTALRCTACGALFSASHISQLRCAADSGCVHTTGILIQYSRRTVADTCDTLQ